MRVAIVQESSGVRRGGAETSVVEMARHLAALGLDITLITSAAAKLATGTPAADPTLGAAPQPAVRAIPLTASTKLGRARQFVVAVDKLCALERFDVVHAVSPCLSATIYQPRGGTYAETIVRTLARTSSRPLRFIKRIGRRLNFRQAYLLSIERSLLTRNPPPFVAAVSDYVRRQVLDGFDLPPDRVRVVFNGVDAPSPTTEEAAALRHSLRARFNIAADRPVVLFVAHNFRLKGLGELLRALATPAGCDGNWHLLVAGRDRREPFEGKGARLGVRDRVGFIGAEHSMSSLYAAADALAHPTWYDPCSRVVLEALSLGLPAVTTRLNGATEVMQPGRHGVVIERPDQIDELAAGIAQCLSPQLRELCQADAPSIRVRVSMRRHAEELKALYQSIVGRA